MGRQEVSGLKKKQRINKEASLINNPTLRRLGHNAFDTINRGNNPASKRVLDFAGDTTSTVALHQYTPEELHELQTGKSLENLSRGASGFQNYMIQKNIEKQFI